MKKNIFYIVALLMAFPTLANWQLDSQSSVVSFTTFKKEHIAENHRFHKVSATIAKQGKVELVVNLASVDTKIAIRDQRMKEHLFDLNNFPKATFSAQLDEQALQSLTAGDSQVMAVSGTITLHGQTQAVIANVLVTKVSEHRILVVSTEPLLIKAQEFALVAGINKLAEIANLPSISQTVPVNFILSFTR